MDKVVSGELRFSQLWGVRPHMPACFLSVQLSERLAGGKAMAGASRWQEHLASMLPS